MTIKTTEKSQTRQRPLQTTHNDYRRAIDESLTTKEESKATIDNYRQVIEKARSTTDELQTITDESKTITGNMDCISLFSAEKILYITIATKFLLYQIYTTTFEHAKNAKVNSEC